MKSRDLLILSILTFVTVVIWVLADAWHAYVTSTITASLSQTIKPLTPKLDTGVIESLKKRQGGP